MYMYQIVVQVIITVVSYSVIQADIHSYSYSVTAALTAEGLILAFQVDDDDDDDDDDDAVTIISYQGNLAIDV